jgi:hypothetical protein
MAEPVAPRTGRQDASNGTAPQLTDDTEFATGYASAERPSRSAPAEPAANSAALTALRHSKPEAYRSQHADKDVVERMRASRDAEAAVYEQHSKESAGQAAKHEAVRFEAFAQRAQIMRA